MATQLTAEGLQIEQQSSSPSGVSGSAVLYTKGNVVYMNANNGGEVQLTPFDIDQLSALGGANLHLTQDHLVVSDNGTEKKILFEDVQNSIFANVSGQAAIAASGSLSLDVSAITAQTNMTGDVDDADELMINDGGVLKRIDFSVLRDAVFNDVSGDAAIADGGALTIANDAVESGMLNDNVISGQTELDSDGLAAADELMISDGGTLKKIGVDNLFKDGPGLLGAEAIAVGSDHFMFLDGGATGDAKVESVADLMTAVAGDGLAASSGVLAVGVDDSSIELSSDAVRVKVGGVTNAMLAGSIANGKLSNSAITIAGSSTALGSSISAATIAAAVDGEDMAITALTDLDFKTAGNKTIFDTIGANTLTYGASTTTSSFAGKVTIAGDLSVAGTTTTVSSTAVEIGDRIVELNTAGASGDAGIYVQDATTNQTGSLLWDSSADTWMGGLKDAEVHLVNLSSAQTLTNKVLTEPDINTPDIDGGTIDDVTLGGTLAGTPTFSGVGTHSALDVFNAGISVKNGASSAGFINFFEDSDNGTNSAKLIGPASTGDVTITLPAATDTLVGKATTDTLTNKTLTAPTINGVVGGTTTSQTITTLTTAGITATANIDIGAYEMRAQTFESDVTTGTAPIVVASTTECTNLNAAKLSGADWDAPLAIGGTTAAAGTFTSIVGTGLDMNGNADISGDLTLSGGGDGALSFENDGQNSIKIPDNQGQALIIEEADNAYMTFNSTNSAEGIQFDKGVIMSGSQKLYFEDATNYDQYIGSAGSGVTQIASPSLLVSAPEAVFTSATSMMPQVTIKNTNANGFGASLIFQKDGTSAAANDILGSMTFVGENSADEDITYASIAARSTDVSDSSEDGSMHFTSIVGGSQVGWLDFNSTAASQATFASTVDVKAKSFITYSDRELKTNIQPMNNALEKVMKLEAVSYDLKSGSKNEIGFIAQDVAKVAPEICALDKNGVGRGIDYSRMSTLLVGALKAQQDQIQELKEVIAKLQK